MTRSSKRVVALSAVVLAGLSLMIFAGACSRSNQSTGQSNRGATQTEQIDSATQYNRQTPNQYDNNQASPGGSATDLQKDVADFRNQIQKKVADNATAINDKRAELARAHNSTRAEFTKMLDDAEQRNNEIRDRVLNYTATDRAAWDQFRDGTNRALDDVAASVHRINVR
jgi:hypothetical protein